MIHRTLSVILFVLACLPVRLIFADPVCIEMHCCGTVCGCEDMSCCNAACGIGTGDSSTEGGGFGLFTPSPPDPEAEARAAEAARVAAELRAAELREAMEAFAAVAGARLAREARGRDLHAAWQALAEALDSARGQPPAKEVLRGLMVPLPKRGRTPIPAADQAGCASFHSSLALAMGHWRVTTIPPVDPVFLDAERIAHEAGTVFDRGESIAGCETLARVGPVTAAETVHADPAGAAKRVSAALPELREAAQRVERAQAQSTLANLALDAAKNAVAEAAAKRDAELLKAETERNDRDGALRKAEAARKDTDLRVKKETKPSWTQQKQAQHEAFQALLKQQEEAKKREDDARKAKLEADTAVQALKDKKSKEQKEEEARLHAAEKKKQEEQAQLQAEREAAERLRQEALAAQAAIDPPDQAKPRATRFYRQAPRLTRKLVIR